MKTTLLERSNLEAHVDLCAQRYKELDERLNRVEHRLDSLITSVDERFDRMEHTLASINSKLEKSNSERNRQLITTAATVILTLLAALGWAINRLI